MKVKTITCHRVYNHGATLQQYALLRYLESQGHEAETINYTPEYLSNHHKFSIVSNPKFEKNFILKWIYLILKFPGRLIMLRRKIAFDTFENKHIKSTVINYKTNEEIKENLPDADAYICGSDQIWNSFFQNGRDPAFYLDFVPDNKPKISYAASFAIKKLETKVEDFVFQKVSRIDYVSVREKSALDILDKIGIKNAERVLDPVFLIDKEDWVRDFVKPINDDFIFVYDCDSNPAIKKTVLKASKDEGLKIYTVNKNIKYAHKNFYKKDSSFFLSLIYSSKYVVSNSFHAVAFSLIFNKNFFVFDRSESINTRMRDIMLMLGLEHLHLSFDEYKPLKDVKMVYQPINKLLKSNISSSKIFIDNALRIND